MKYLFIVAATFFSMTVLAEGAACVAPQQVKYILIHSIIVKGPSDALIYHTDPLAQVQFDMTTEVVDGLIRNLQPQTVDGALVGYTSVVTQDDLGWNFGNCTDAKLNIDCSGKQLKYFFPTCPEGR
jgi:hypothetical protein